MRILLGDSIFDNKSYIKKSEKDVVKQVVEVTKQPALLLAVDGSVVLDVEDQLKNLPKDATELIISVGGNDALSHLDLLTVKVSSGGEFLNKLANIISAFEVRYERMIKKVLTYNLPTTVCTIYYPNFPQPLHQKLTVMALASFNDIIIKQAFKYNLPILDLRLICTESADYANPIEPSAQGGMKIAKAIEAARYRTR